MKDNVQTVIVQGLGFVGSAMAVVVANSLDEDNNPNFNVVGVDLPNQLGKERIDKINSGIFPFATKDKKIMEGTESAIKRGNLRATSDENIFSQADIILVSINLDLSFRDKNPAINIDAFKSAVHTFAKKIKEGCLVIVETTVPPGTSEKIVKPIIKSHLEERGLNPDKIFIAHSYERVMPGADYMDSIKNFWRVYAGLTDEAANKCELFLSQIINVKDFPLTRLHSTTASELSKVLENSYRATNIAFIEEWSRFAEDINVDLFQVIDAIRIRPTHSNIRQPGFGVGGYCLTKDPLFAKIAAKEIFGLEGHDFTYSTLSVKINQMMPLVTLNKIKHFFSDNINGKKILLMGVSYRQDVGDTRYSPSETFYISAEEDGATITPHDPLVDFWDETGLTLDKNMPEAKKFDAIVFAVPHEEYRKIDMENWLVNVDDCLIFDANNVLTKKQREVVTDKGLNLITIGRG